MNDNDSQWGAVLEAIRGASPTSFKTNFLGSEARIDGDRLIVSLPDSANAEWVENRQSGVVKRIVKSAYGREFEIEFTQGAKTRTRTVEQVMSTTDDSDGFDMPMENWSKLPHDLIAQFDKIRTISELKVILYILRHTWGFQDEWKKITMDEFVNGRRTNNLKYACHCDKCNGKRIDHGVSMAAKNIRDGLKRAVDHRFINVEIDDSDKARVKKYYSLNYRK